MNHSNYLPLDTAKGTIKPALHALKTVDPSQNVLYIKFSLSDDNCWYEDSEHQFNIREGWYRLIQAPVIDALENDIHEIIEVSYILDTDYDVIDTDEVNHFFAVVPVFMELGDDILIIQ